MADNAAQPIGYILVDRYTNAIDWDGVIHDTEESAVREAGSEVYKDWLRGGDIESRPDDCWPMAYQVMAVVPCPSADAKALAVLQAEWDRRYRDV